jgi:hypothetical protein
MAKNFDKALMEKFETIYVWHGSKESVSELTADNTALSIIPGGLEYARGVEE